MAVRQNNVNSFRPRKVEDHEIVDSNGEVVGHVRVTPSAVKWSPKNGRGWYSISLKKFGELAETHGKKQRK